MTPAEWMQAYLENSLSAADADAFRAWLAEDPAHVKRLVGEAFLDSHLYDLLGEQKVREDFLAMALDAPALRDHSPYPHGATRGARALPLVPAPPPATLPPATVPPPPAPGFPGTLLHLTGDTPGAAALMWLVMASCALMTLGVMVLVVLAVRGVHVTVEPREVAEAPDVSSTDQRPPTPEHSAPVARLIRGADCVWDEAEAAPSPGEELAPGRLLQLKSGLAEIVFQKGAKVLLEGPAELKIGSRSSAFLARGSLAATVEGPRAKGFDIQTPGMKYTDLGTEFGVRVAKDGVQEVHVFRGTVQAEEAVVSGQWSVDSGTATAENSNPAISNLKSKIQNPKSPPLLLTAHEAIRVVAADQPIQRIAAAPQQFVRAEKFARILEEQNPAFQRFKAFREKLCRRDDLVAYYDFQADDADALVLRNRAASGSRLDGRLQGGAAWAPGRFPGKQALRFAERKAEVRVNIPLESHELTLAAWAQVEPSQGDVLENVLLMCDGWGDKSTMTCWEINHHLGRLNFDLGDRSAVLSPLVFTVDGHNGWRFLVATANWPAGKLRHYLDGRLLAENNSRQRSDKLIGPAAIGNWEDLGIYHGERRPFGGAIEQLMVFRKALSAEEVATLYEATK